MSDAPESGMYFASERAPEGAALASPTWLDLDAIDPVEFVRGLRFRTVVGERMLVNFATYAPGTIVPEHAHEEEQVTFVLEGEFEFTMDGETRTMIPGMVAHVPPFVPHAARTRETGCVQVDVFAPPRRVLLEALRARETGGS